MALTVHDVFETMWEDFYVILKTVDFDSSYPTGGEALTDTTLGLADDNLHVLCFEKSGYGFEYDRANQKLLAYYGDNDNASDGPKVEVADTTNLATLTGVQVLAIGKAPA